MRRIACALSTDVGQLLNANDNRSTIDECNDRLLQAVREDRIGAANRVSALLKH
jgi:hypothetical protein